MTIVWSDSRAEVDWHELEALYRAAPLGNKNADDLQVVFGNSMFCCFAREEGRLVGAGGFWLTDATAPTSATLPCCPVIRAWVWESRLSNG
jgi:hypothetical protein